MYIHPAFCPIAKNTIDSILSSNAPESTRYTNVFVGLGIIQGMIISEVLRQKIGEKVYSGPFKGMALTPDAMSKHYGPVLLGVYEQELHESFAQIIAHPYKTILNIGCSFGYYATGLARLMPNAKVLAFDIDEKARTQCTEMTRLNNVADRVSIHGEFPGADFAKFADEETFVLMDIEGAEHALLDPALYPALQKMDILVEMHDCVEAKLSQLIPSRFEKTHDIKIIRNNPKSFPLYTIFGDSLYFQELDDMIVTMECRAGPTPWAFMTRKNR